jgi:hypothetical protein
MLVSVSAALAPQAWAGQVTTSADSGLDGSLRFEIQNAAAGETITIDPGINPTVTTGHIPVAQDITLVGQGMGQTTITGPAADRIFLVNQSAATKTVTMEGLTITGGHAISGSTPGQGGASGGGIYLQQGHLVLDSVEMSGNFAGNGANGEPGPNNGSGNGGEGGPGGTAGQAGAVLAAAGELTIRDSSFHDNSAGTAGNGGPGGNGAGLFSGGDGGDGGEGGPGGAIATSVPTQIFNTTFANNHATAGGAGAAGGSGLLSGAGGSGARGGEGGAVYNPLVTTLRIEGSTFTGNTAGGGGAGGPAPFGSVGGDGGPGGALSAESGEVINSTFNANQSGSGGAGAGPIGGGGAGGNGGAIFGTASVHFSTIAGNVAGLGGGGNTPGLNGAGGGIHLSTAQAIDASILAGNSAGGSTSQAASNCSGVAATGTHALTFPGSTGCPGAVGNPLLGPLASNGGPTQTMALGAGSAAIDQVPAGECIATDQRGAPRPQGAACDIGAFEAPVSPIEAPVSPTPTTAPTGKKKKTCKKRKKHRREASAAKKKKCKKKRKR